MILGLDPGYEHCGWAYCDQGVIVRSGKEVGLWNEVGAKVPLDQCSILVVERMESYPHSGVDANDLIKVTRLGGEIMGRAPGAVWIHPWPREWKGSLTKAVHHRRLKRDHPELRKIDDTDELDACGLALWGWKCTS